MTAPSLAEVAALSGVSLTTASRVLNPTNRHPVSAAARARVIDAAERLHYSSNALARGLKSSRTRTVGLIAHDIANPYFNEFARGVSDAADEAGFLTVLCNTNHDEDTELRYVQMLQDHRVAGVVFIAGGFEGRRYREEIRKRVAGIRDYGGHLIGLGPRSDDLPGEVPDNRSGARQATEHLLELGHERIAFVAGTVGVGTATERFKGFRETLDAAGIAFDERLVAAGGFSEEGGAVAMRQLLDLREPFTAVFAANDTMAMGCLQELARRGMRPPRDISLVGFDDIPFAQWLNPALTTVSVPMSEIGAAGMRRLLALLDGERDGTERPRVNRHPTKLVVRASTGPPVVGRVR